MLIVGSPRRGLVALALPLVVIVLAGCIDGYPTVVEIPSPTRLGAVHWSDPCPPTPPFLPGQEPNPAYPCSLVMPTSLPTGYDRAAFTLSYPNNPELGSLEKSLSTTSPPGTDVGVFATFWPWPNVKFCIKARTAGQGGFSLPTVGCGTVTDATNQGLVLDP